MPNIENQYEILQQGNGTACLQGLLNQIGGSGIRLRPGMVINVDRPGVNQAIWPVNTVSNVYGYPFCAEHYVGSLPPLKQPITKTYEPSRTALNLIKQIAETEKPKGEKLHSSESVIADVALANF